MMKLFKIISGLLTSLCLLMPLSVSAEEVVQTSGGYSQDGLWYYNDYGDGTVSVVCQDNTIEEAVIPSEIDGHKITMVELDCFKDNTSLKKVTLPDTITVLEDYAFYLCSGLEEINIPASVQKFGFQTFYGCSSLKEISVPAGVTEIEGYTFDGCTALEAVHVEKNNQNYKDQDGILFTKDGSDLILYPAAKTGKQYAVPDGCTKLEGYAFMANSDLEQINLNAVSEMGEDVFYYCTSLQSITVPDGITMLTGAAFGNCTSLKRVTLPETLETIGSGCFYNCLQLDEITIPDSVTTINSNAFFNCPSLTTIRVSRNVTTVGDYAFGFYSGEEEEPQLLPDFELDADNGTAAFAYAVKFNVRCTGGVTQGIVFVYIMIGIVALVIIAVIVLIVMQKRIQKQRELF
ncbi:MAG: leucine-rich repeat domain-containing protein [Oscillospiraceae bacterium]|nr:leucine-rich repeat domain-containing protein [Oscillospiraceae bacterium]